MRLWPEDPLQALAKREDSAALKELGQAPALQGLGDVEAKLKAKLNGGSYDEAVASDALHGAFVVLDGWHVPEATALAALPPRNRGSPASRPAPRSAPRT